MGADWAMASHTTPNDSPTDKLPVVREMRTAGPWVDRSAVSFEPFESNPAPGRARSAGLPAFSFGALWTQSRWWMIGAMAGLCLALIPAVWLLIRPMYQATALIRVSPKALRIAFKNEENSSASLYKTFVNTQVSILRGANVLQRVLDQPKVRDTAWYQVPPKPFLGYPLPPLERLSRALAVKAYRESELVEVSVSAERPGDARTLVNTVVDEHKKLSDETLREADTQRYETLVEEHNRLQKEIDGLIKTKFGIAKQLGTAAPEELRSQLSTHLSRLEEERGKLERTLKLAEGDLEWFAQNQSDASASERPGAGEPALDDALRFPADAEWRRLRMAAEDARHQLDVALQDFGDEHPRIKQLRSSVEFAQKMLADREDQVNGQADFNNLTGHEGSGSVLGRAALERQAERIRRQVSLLRTEIEQQRARVATAGDLASDLAQYDEQVRRKRELSETLHHRLTELELEGKAPARISIEAHAVDPARPFRDSRWMLTGLVFGAALVTSLGVGYVRLVFDPLVRVASDVCDTVQAPFLGHLPPLPTTPLVLEGATPFLLESLRMVRTSLLQRVPQGACGVVLVSSTTSRTGKTSVSALLGQSFASLGRKTLIVEADLRRPSLGERLGVKMQTGLAALLSGEKGPGDVVIRTDVPRLSVVLAGEISEEFDPELLSDGSFENALAAWRKEYEFILVDSPPVLPVADSRILAPMTDGALLVVRSSHTRRDDVQQAWTDLLSAGGGLLGTVLIGARFGSGYGYERQYYAYANRALPVGV